MCIVPSTLLSPASFTSLCVIVDHLHFQDNGFLLRILLISLLCLEEGNDLIAIVDHLHFQDNGFLLGILLISLLCLEEGNDLIGGLVLSVLLYFKHLFAVVAPALLLRIGEDLEEEALHPLSSCDNLYPGPDCLVSLKLGAIHCHQGIAPIRLFAVQSLDNARHYFLLSIVSCDSLFPLLHDALQGWYG
ncbi:hypothetical protein DVH24_013855 [Malus domestica]|uniref:Alpha-1,3-glucosyltransferase n=1 Tax=Malus domestica TaxID=3750 RepID=A0A498JBU9_MALDO|nr:hypothetical protein DVH24_013855 [Malus domestica]